MLSTDAKSPESALIRAATLSSFSHASIYDGQLNYYEAADDGVANFNDRDPNGSVDGELRS